MFILAKGLSSITNSKRLALVADKNRTDNITICKMLENLGFNTASVFDFTEALVVLQRISLAIVVLDSFFENA